MARGWESKAVEDQISERVEAKLRAAQSGKVTDVERERAAERTALELSRAQILRQLEGARLPNHRHTLECALAALEAKLSALS